jgi:hypothetical protein
MTLRRLGLVALAVALFALGSAQVASADGGVRPLTGEEMLVQDANVNFNCNPATNSTVTYSASGIATGPYPGPFWVAGVVTIGPQTQPGPRPGTVAGPLLSLFEVFFINSPLGTVTGVKKLTHPSASDEGSCQTVTDFDVDPVADASGTVVDIFSQPRYVALIREPGGWFHDRGDALLSLSELDLSGTCAGQPCDFRQAAFSQGFISSEPPPGDDDDDSDMDDDIEDELDD